MTPERFREVEKLFHLAREKGIGALSGADEDVRRHVEELLRQRGTFLDGPAWAGIEERTQSATNLVAGAQLGPYRIDGPIGAGGMGQVFRATDTRLGRSVAIKVSAAKFGARFEREAKAISSLNHPRICTLHDVGPNYLVMELVEGETLAERLKRGKMAAGDVLKYGAQIADALAAAHAKGIIHRDLKPGNIMLTKQGVKVLDFGLAKAPDDETLTATGFAMGTPAYMAPEQREGSETDARTDIYALGLVLHEMAAGKRWKGEPSAELAAAPHVSHVIEQCLQADPEHRWQSAVDVRHELEWASRAPLASAPRADSAASWLPAAAAIAALGVAGAFGYLWYSERAKAADENPLAGAQFTRFTDFESAETDAAISRDGRYVAFRSDRDGTADTWLSQVGTGRFINMTKGIQPPVLVDNVGFTPDGSELWLSGIIGGPRLRLMPVSGGTPRAFLAEHAMNVAWSPDGSRLVWQDHDPGDPLTVADAAGANGKQIFLAKHPRHNHFPIWSTDGQWIYFVSGAWDTREMDVWRIRPEGGEPEKLTSLGTDIKYLAPIDDHTILFSSPAQDGSGPWLWSLNTSTRQVRRASYGLERYTSVEASGDGRRLAATVSNPSANLWSLPLDEGLSRETDLKPYPVPSGRAFAPRFSAGALYYLSSRGAGDGLWRYQGDRVDELWRGIDGALQEPAAPSPDGHRLAIILRRQGRRTLHTLSSEGGDLRKVAETLDVTSVASWSPDGAWIAICGADAQGPGLFKVPVPNGAPIRLRKGACSSPIWSPDGSLIAFLNPTNARMGLVQFIESSSGAAVDSPRLQVRIGGERFRFVPGRAQLIYMLDTESTKQTFWLYDLRSKTSKQISEAALAGTRTFDVSPDGKQIVFDRLRENADVVLIDLKKRD